jgi:hypothetical protein
MSAKVALAVIVLAASFTLVQAMAQANDNHSQLTHQIDRFEAIRLLQESLKSAPNDAAAWIVLGELAHDVAQDLSSQEDQRYYKLSQEAYERALALQPKSNILRGAVELAREQKSGAAQWDQTRREAARNYIATRKQELAGSGFGATIQPVSVRAATPPAAAAAAISTPASQPAQTYQYMPAQTYQYLVYQPSSVPTAQPYLYQQNTGSYLNSPPVYYTYTPAPKVASRGAHRRRSER